MCYYGGQEVDIIVLIDGLYQLLTINVNVVKTGLDCFDMCDVVRDKLAYFDKEQWKYIMKDTGGIFYGCICR